MRQRFLFVALVLLALAWAGCSGTRDCSNGTCACEPGQICDFVCQAPPCHVDCEGNNPSCQGTCGNATCTCGPGSSCEFECESGPCHVDCQGDNAECSGTCANGTCYCGPGSNCEFDCQDDNCKFNCDGACLLDCEEEGQTRANCSFNSCAAGEPVSCPDGAHIACGRECPAPSADDED